MNKRGHALQTRKEMESNLHRFEGSKLRVHSGNHHPLKLDFTMRLRFRNLTYITNLEAGKQIQSGIIELSRMIKDNKNLRHRLTCCDPAEDIDQSLRNLLNVGQILFQSISAQFNIFFTVLIARQINNH